MAPHILAPPSRLFSKDNKEVSHGLTLMGRLSLNRLSGGGKSARSYVLHVKRKCHVETDSDQALRKFFVPSSLVEHSPIRFIVFRTLCGSIFPRCSSMARCSVVEFNTTSSGLAFRYLLHPTASLDMRIATLSLRRCLHADNKIPTNNYMQPLVAENAWVGQPIDACMNKWTKEWINEGKTERRNAWRTKRRNERRNEWRNERGNEWTKERTTEWMKEWTTEWMNEGMNQEWTTE